MKKIVIMVDGSNNGKSLRAANFRMDYDKTRVHFASYGELVGCFYFTALPPKEVQSPLRGLVHALEHNGWDIISRETKSYLNETNGLTRMKGNMDVDICVKALTMAYDAGITDLVLFSGDGDFVSLVRALHHKGVRVRVVSHRSYDSTSVASEELIRAASEFINLCDLRSEIEFLRKV